MVTHRVLRIVCSLGLHPHCSLRPKGESRRCARALSGPSTSGGAGLGNNTVSSARKGGGRGEEALSASAGRVRGAPTWGQGG